MKARPAYCARVTTFRFISCVSSCPVVFTPRFVSFTLDADRVYDSRITEWDSHRAQVESVLQVLFIDAAFFGTSHHSTHGHPPVPRPSVVKQVPTCLRRTPHHGPHGTRQTGHAKPAGGFTNRRACTWECCVCGTLFGDES